MALQAELQAFDDAQFAAVNGDAGGNWTPSASTSIAGAGLDVKGQSAFALGSNSFTWTTSAVGVVSLASGSATTANGTWSLGEDASIAFNNATTYASGAAFTWLASSFPTFQPNTNLVWNGNVSGAATIPATATWKLLNGATLTQQSGSTVSVSGGTFTGETTSSISFANTVSFASSASVTQNGKVIISGAAAQTGWRVGNGTDANGNYSAQNDVWVVPTLTTNRTYTVLHTSGVIPAEGTRLHFHWYRAIAVTGTLKLVRENGSTIAETVSPVLGDNFFIELMFRDGAWHAHRWGALVGGGIPQGG